MTTIHEHLSITMPGLCQKSVSKIDTVGMTQKPSGSRAQAISPMPLCQKPKSYLYSFDPRHAWNHADPWSLCQKTTLFGQIRLRWGNGKIATPRVCTDLGSRFLTHLTRKDRNIKDSSRKSVSIKLRAVYT